MLEVLSDCVGGSSILCCNCLEIILDHVVARRFFQTVLEVFSDCVGGSFRLCWRFFYTVMLFGGSFRLCCCLEVLLYCVVVWRFFQTVLEVLSDCSGGSFRLCCCLEVVFLSYTHTNNSIYIEPK